MPVETEEIAAEGGERDRRQDVPRRPLELTGKPGSQRAKGDALQAVPQSVQRGRWRNSAAEPDGPVARAQGRFSHPAEPQAARDSASSSGGEASSSSSSTPKHHAGLEDAAGPLLEDSGVSPEAIAAFCEEVMAAVRRAQAVGVASCSRAAAPPPPAKDGPARDSDCLLRVENMLPMYGGSVQPLQGNATLDFVRGHRYGIVGASGSGKTTLVVHLRHEAILRGVPQATNTR